MTLVCPKCPRARRTQFSSPGKANDLCDVHGWIEGVEVVPAEQPRLRALRRSNDGSPLTAATDTTGLEVWTCELCGPRVHVHGRP